MKNQRIASRRKQVKLNKKRIERNKRRKKIRYHDLKEAQKERTMKKNERLQSNKYNG